MESISVIIPPIHSSSKRFDKDSSPPEHDPMTENMMNIDTPEANDGANGSEDCGSISNLPRTPKSDDHLDGNHNIDDGNGASSFFPCEQCSKTFPTERGLFNHRGWHKKHFKPVSVSDVPSKRKRERSTAIASTISDVVQASDSNKQSLAFSIHRRDLTEEKKRILKTFLRVNRERRHIEMPGHFDASGYVKYRWRNVICPLMTKLRKSCDACQQGILICETDPNGSCAACLKSGKDCSFQEPKQTRVYSSQADSTKRKVMALSRENPTDGGTSDQEYVPNPKPTSVGKRRLSEKVQKMKTKSAKPSEPNSFSRKEPSTQIISTSLAEENGLSSMLCEDELQSDFAASAAHLRPSQQDRNTSVLPPLDKSMQTLFGREVLDDEKLVDLFKILASTIGQYHFATNNARYLDDVQRTSFLRAPLEELESSSPKHKLIESLREILAVPQGIDVYQQARSLGIQNIDQSDLVQAVLAICVRDMIFGGNPPFGDEALWREELQHSFGLKVANMVLQSRRIRMSNERAFQETMLKRSEVHVWRMNQLMFPLVGGTAHIHENLHRRLANRTTDIHTKIHAFSDFWISIWAGFGAAFNPTFHIAERLNHNESLTNRQVLMTVCPGIRRQLPDGDWFPCVKARVVLLDARPPE